MIKHHLWLSIMGISDGPAEFVKRGTINVRSIKSGTAQYSHDGGRLSEDLQQNIKVCINIWWYILVSVVSLLFLFLPFEFSAIDTTICGASVYMVLAIFKCVHSSIHPPVCLSIYSFIPSWSSIHSCPLLLFQELVKNDGLYKIRIGSKPVGSDTMEYVTAFTKAVSHLSIVLAFQSYSYLLTLKEQYLML